MSQIPTDEEYAKHVGQRINRIESENERLREENRLLKDYATYRGICGLESSEGLSFSAWVAEHCQPRVAVGEREGGKNG